MFTIKTEYDTQEDDTMRYRVVTVALMDASGSCLAAKSFKAPVAEPGRRDIADLRATAYREGLKDALAGIHQVFVAKVEER